MIVSCQNCGWTGDYDNAVSAHEITQRHSIGDVYSDVECPACAALCYPVKEAVAPQFDEDNLAKVARIVTKFNPHAPGDVVDHMKNTARDLSENCTYIAVAGYMLTAFWPRHDPDTMHVKASVADHCFPE